MKEVHTTEKQVYYMRDNSDGNGNTEQVRIVSLGICFIFSLNRSLRINLYFFIISLNLIASLRKYSAYQNI